MDTIEWNGPRNEDLDDVWGPGFVAVVPEPRVSLLQRFVGATAALVRSARGRLARGSRELARVGPTVGEPSFA